MQEVEIEAMQSTHYVYANHAVINASTVKADSGPFIPLPPLAEQKRIVAKLEELLPLCERLK